MFVLLFSTSLLLTAKANDLCPPMVELLNYDFVKDGIEKSELDNLRLNEDLKNKAVTMKAAEPDLKDYLKRDMEVLEKSLGFKTVDSLSTKDSKELLNEAKKVSLQRSDAGNDLTKAILKVREQSAKNLKSFQKIFEKCRKPGNS